MSEIRKRGLIDIHSHLLPGVDDGCVDLEESLVCIKRLRLAGFVGTVCTPHAGEGFALPVTDELVDQWVSDLRDQLKLAGVKYELWSGAETSLSPNIIDWFKNYGVITLGDSRCVLVDLWVERWEKWINVTFEWLFKEGYQPVLAHPERIPCGGELNKRLLELEGMGVWLQGNFQCITGEAGYQPDVMVRQLLLEDRYRFMALDMHQFSTLEGRLDGVEMIEVEYGSERVERLTSDGPREMLSI